MMKKNKRYAIVDKSEIQHCWKCEGKGFIKGDSCSLCYGTGTFRESHYIVIDEKMKIAFDSDTGG